MVNDKNLNSDNFEISVYWIWLQLCLGFGNVKIRFFIKKDISITSFYNYSEYDLCKLMFFSKKEIENFKKFSLNDALKIFEYCKKNDICIICIGDKRYPKLLNFISNPPCVLYAKGDVAVLDSEFIISIVGSRSATYYGVELAFKFASEIASEPNSVVVSGGALGIDSWAHRGAISVNGKTISVLGCGIDFPYLVSNKELREKISENGLLISEYPPEYEIRNYHFPLRNRLISGLSYATVVIEAGRRSGALITANLATEQNRDVFVTPILQNNPLSEGIFDLIKDGAKVVKNGNDIIEYYKFNKIQNNSIFLFNKNKNESKNQIKFEINQNKEINLENSPEEMKNIFNVIKNNEKNNGIHINDIKEITGLNINLVLSNITKMEIMGIVKKMSGKIYKIK